MKTVLYTTYHEDQFAARAMELKLALQLNDAAFDLVHVSVSGECDRWPSAQGDVLEFSGSRRPTYSWMLEWMTGDLGPEDVVVLANCDMVIPRATLERIAYDLSSGQVYALSRWEVAGPTPMQLCDASYSQDVWCFRGPPRPSIGGDYWFGVPGCDNRFAYELYAAEYEVLNPSRDIQTYHMHATGARTKTNAESYRVPPPYLYVSPHHVGEEPQRQVVETAEEWRAAIQARRRRTRR